MSLTIKIIVGIAALCIAVFAVFALIDGAYMKKRYESVWDERYINDLGNDMEKVLAYAIRASSSHNMQPWKAQIMGDDEIYIYADTDKALSVADKSNWQMLISQGTFLKALKDGAKALGYEADIAAKNPDFNQRYPLSASVKFSKSEVAYDAVSGASLSLRTASPADIDEAIKECFIDERNIGYKLIEDKDEVEKLKKLLLEGVRIESFNEDATGELIDIFRFTEREKNEYKYGLSLNSSGLATVFMGPIAKAFSRNTESFGQSSITSFETRLDSEFAYIILLCDTPGAIDYIDTGYKLGELSAGLKGYKVWPAVQLLEEIEGMDTLYEQFADEFELQGRAVMIAGISYADEKSIHHNPRSLVEDILIER